MWASLAAQTAFFFDIGTGKKGLVKWSVPIGDTMLYGFTLTSKVLNK